MRPVLLALTLACPAVAAAQVPQLVPGSRVRVQAPTATAREITGTVMSQTPDTLAVAVSGAVLYRLPSASITRLRISEGKSHGAGALRGMKWGAGIGLGLWSLVILAVAADGDPTTTVEGPDDVALGLVQIASGGAFWGAGIGALIGAERWRSVPIAAPGAGLGRAPDGAPAIVLSLRF